MIFFICSLLFAIKAQADTIPAKLINHNELFISLATPLLEESSVDLLVYEEGEDREGRVRRKLQEEQFKRNQEKQNDEIFKNLRSGLGDWSDKGQRVKKNPNELLDKLNERTQVHKKQPQRPKQAKQNVPQFGQIQYLDQAQLIDQQVLQPQQSNPPPPKKQSSLKIQRIFQVIISCLIVIYLLSCIKKRCCNQQPRVQVPHEQTETLTDF